jgi:hypothetical protein
MTALACPSLADLLVSDSELSDELRGHLAACRRCRALRRHMLERALAVEIAADAPALGKKPQERLSGATDRTVGGVYALHGPVADEYLIGALVDWDEEEAVVIPISDAVTNATDWDLLIGPEALGYPAMAEAWNHGTVLVEQLEEKLGELGGLTEPLVALYEAALAGDAVPEEMLAGVAVLADADPRLLFQDEESERVSDFWQPATLLAGVASVGELVRLQREELAIESPELVDFVEPEALAALEGDRLDMAGALAPAAFGRLMRQLGVTWSRRFRALARATALATYRDPLEGAAGVALYRSRRGGGRRAKQEAQKERAVEQWLDSVMEEMER